MWPYFLPEAHFKASYLGTASAQRATNPSGFFFWKLSLNDSKNSLAWQRGRVRIT